MRNPVTLPKIAAFIVAFAAGIPQPHADAPSMQSELHALELDWAHVTYQLHDTDEQDTQMKALAGRAAAIAEKYPGRAEPLIWEGVIASSEAKYAGAFGALSAARQARDYFEAAGHIDYRALDGSVPTSLGALYYLVPGFPIGFGDNDKARRYLEQGVQISPNGLDANYFYGDFLYRDGDYDKAVSVLEHGLAAPADTERPVWDAGRRAEMQAVLAEAEKHLVASR